jgi:MoxR-like ATPase
MMNSKPRPPSLKTPVPEGNKSSIDMERVTSILGRALQNIQTVIIGKEAQIQQALTCWLARGHLLIEDVPGTGKTILARSIATTISVPFNRIQFTPDLLPGDIIGSSVFRQDQNIFEFINGPLFTTVLLADEINRATPRTQSALLEAMSESQITAEGKTYKLDELFFTIATQNPVEQLGTFPLPEAQLDRFMMRMSMGYPSVQDEKAWLMAIGAKHPVESLKPVVEAEEWRWLTEQVGNVLISDEAYDYIMQVVAKTRIHKELRIGASPRAALSLKKACQARALLARSGFVTPEHIYDLMIPVLAHRLVLTTEARLSERTALKILEEIRATLAVPIRKR